MEPDASVKWPRDREMPLLDRRSWLALSLLVLAGGARAGERELCPQVWQRLELAHELICNQPEDVMRRMVLAKTAAGDLAVAYLPNNETIEMDVSVFPQPLRARWFDPLEGAYEPVASEVVKQGIRQFVLLRNGDWVLQLTKLR